MKKLILATIDNIPNKDYEIVDLIKFDSHDLWAYREWWQAYRENNYNDIEIVEKITKGCIFKGKKEYNYEILLRDLQIRKKFDAIIGIRPDYHTTYQPEYYDENSNYGQVRTGYEQKYIGTAIRFKTNKK
ncbi:MAG: hypothetical protein K2I36_02300 [Ureaplasma sp.]|nr:hypothetical protein [Ureaplasma sp.]